jgi:hypothetical protein
MKIRSSVEGLDSLRGGLARIADKAALADAVAVTAEEVRAAARANLQDSGPPGNGRGQLADSLVIAPAADGLSVTVGTTAAQGWNLEFGTVARPATPWLGPALEAARPGILTRLRQRLAASAKR